MVQTITVDPKGRITLPQHILTALGIEKEAELIIEMTQSGLMLKPLHDLPPLTAQLALLNLPIADWPQMEAEILDFTS